MNNDTLLKVNNLSTQFFTQNGQVNAVENVSFNVEAGEVYGIVGESGSGKSVMAMSIMDIVESPGKITNGEIWYHNEEIISLLEKQYPTAVGKHGVEIQRLPKNIRQILRGKYFSMIFQNPKDSFNKSYTIGNQIAEAVEINRRINRNIDQFDKLNYTLSDYIFDKITLRNFLTDESREKAVELLSLVGIPDPVERADEYPYQFSGGMLQRAMIAQALAGDPDLLIADEPTTALDVTIQSQIINILENIQDRTGMAIILITHDLGVIARMCDRVGVMYAGEIVEKGSLHDIFNDFVHPYTGGLLRSSPSWNVDSTKLKPIAGNVPDLYDGDMGDECYFIDRCPNAMEKCAQKPEDFQVGVGHAVKCYLATDELNSVDTNNQSYPWGDDTEESMEVN